MFKNLKASEVTFNISIMLTIVCVWGMYKGSGNLFEYWVLAFNAFGFLGYSFMFKIKEGETEYED